MNRQLLIKSLKAVYSQKLLHLVPLTRNFAAVDSIIYDPNDPNAWFTCIKVTRNPDHDKTVSGLQHIESWLKLKSPLKDLPVAKPGRGAFYSLYRLTTPCVPTFTPSLVPLSMAPNPLDILRKGVHVWYFESRIQRIMGM